MPRTYKTIIKKDEESSFELDLAPMLALMVCLIPIMLLSTVFVRVTVIDTPLPQAVEKAIEKDRNKKKREVQVIVDMEKASGFQLNVLVDGRAVKKQSFPKAEGDWDLQGIRKALVDVKVKNPETFRLDLRPGEEVHYDEIVRFMDEVRSTKAEDPKLYVTDEETQEKVETDVMFPDVIFANVMEG